MQIKLYLNDWFFNAGIVGFLEILEYNKREYVLTKDNYIEFDSENLRDFSEDYFKYFFDKHNIAQRTKNRVNANIEGINKIIQNKAMDEANENNIKNKLKYIKNTIKNENDKIKKFNNKVYTLIEEELEKLDTLKFENGVDELKNITDKIISEINKEEINHKITSDSFKKFLSDNYFGQPSFMNVNKNKLSYEAQKDLMYVDYISNIVEVGYLHDFLNGEILETELIEHINEYNDKKCVTKQISKLYKKLLKVYEKNKDIEIVKEEVLKKLNVSCSICGDSHFLTETYSEKHFSPLAASSNNMKNIFWNQNIKFPICDVCKLALLCVPAGVVNIQKIVIVYENNTKEKKSNKVYKEKDVLAFINYDTDVNMLKNTNMNFKYLSKGEKNNNPYAELILSIVDESKYISEWQLQNISIVEFESKYEEFSRLESFNIKRYEATFFKEYAKSILGKITDYKYKLQIIDFILKNKNISSLINDRIREELKNETNYGYNSYLTIRIRMILNLLKKGELKVKEEIEKSNKKVYRLYMCGIEIHNHFKQKNEENKLNGYTYKMLNAVKAGKSSEFMDMLIRLYMYVGKNVPSIFLEIMQDTSLDFSTIGHSFISGLISNKEEKKDGGNENE